jgi:hypothetical protein
MTDIVRQLRRPSVGPSGVRRLRANWPASLKSGPRRTSCRLIDISRDGAGITAMGPLDADRPVWLIVNRMPLMGTIAWRKGDRVGVHFYEPQHWIEEICSQRFDPTAWVTV